MSHYVITKDIINDMDRYHKKLLDCKSVTNEENLIITAKIDAGEISYLDDNYAITYCFTTNTNHIDPSESIVREIENTLGIEVLESTTPYCEFKFKPNEYDFDCKHRESEELSFVMTILNDKIEGLVKMYNFGMPYGYIEYNSGNIAKVCYVRGGNKSTKSDKTWIGKFCSYVASTMNHVAFSDDSIVITKLMLDDGVCVKIEHRYDTKPDALIITFANGPNNLVRLNLNEQPGSLDITMGYGKYNMIYNFQNESYAVKATRLIKGQYNNPISMNLEISLHFKAMLTKFSNALCTGNYDKYINLVLINDVVINCHKLKLNFID